MFPVGTFQTDLGIGPKRALMNQNDRIDVNSSTSDLKLNLRNKEIKTAAGTCDKGETREEETWSPTLQNLGYVDLDLDRT